MKSVRILFLAAAASSVAAANSALCFYPDGVTTEPNHVPCNSTISTSACCDPVDVCSNSGICLGRTGFNYRGSCTDKTWTSPNCATECLADPSNKVPYNSFTALLSCGPSGKFTNNYCCSSPNKNCCTIATFDYGNTGSSFKPGMDRLFQELASLNASGAVTTTVTVTAAPSATGTQSNQAIALRKSDSANIGTAIGAAVGVPLGILAVGILGFLFYRERRHSHFNEQQPIGSRSNIIEMEPPKEYYNPTPPPRPAEPFVPFVEAGGRAAVQSNLPIERRNSTQKSPGYTTRPPSNVHEMI